MIDQIKGQNGRILLAGLAGITAGLITGLLMAPEAGKNTRQNFTKSAMDVGEYFRQALGQKSNAAKPKKAGKKNKKAAGNES